MKLRTTIILLLVTAGLGAYVLLFDKLMPWTRSASENTRFLAQFDETKITGMDITNGDSVIQLRKKDDLWVMVSPVKDRANASSIAPILQAANNLEKSAIVNNLGKGAKLRDAQKDYGVQKAKVRVQLFGEGAPSIMHFGKDTAFEGKIYARLETDSAVSVVSAVLRNFLIKDVADFRDRRLTYFESSNVSGVKFKTSAGEIDLTQTGENWNINTPIKARATNGRVLDLISNVNNINIEQFITQDDTNLAKFGLAEPRGTISFSARDRDEKIDIEIGGPTEKDANKIYVRIPGRPSIFVVPKDIGVALGVKPNDLRDQKLTRVSDDLIDRLTIEKPGQPPLVLFRQEEHWKFLDGGKPANDTEVKRVIDVLNNTETTGFVADTASDLAAYGLDQPVLTAKLSSYSTENTAESPKGETALATVQFGKTDGDKLYARIAEEPFIISVAPGILTNISSMRLAYRSPEVTNFDPSEISSITFQSPGDTPVIVSRDGNKWKSSIEPASSNLDKVAGTLAKLRALRWHSRSSDTGFSNAKTISWQTRTGTRKLLLGALDEDGNTFAKFDDDPDIFLVSVETVQALTPSK